MIGVIRIHGLVKVNKNIESTLDRLRLRRKYVCVILREKPEIIGMLKRVESFIAYGRIDEKTFQELITKRGKSIDRKKIDAKKIISEFSEGKTEKSLEELGIKPFFRLHPPRGGINTRKRFPRGVLGDNKEKINELIRRML